MPITQARQYITMLLISAARVGLTALCRVLTAFAPGCGVRLWLAAGATDMRCSFDGHEPSSSDDQAPTGSTARCSSFAHRDHLLPIVYWDGRGFASCPERRERSRHVSCLPGTARDRLRDQYLLTSDWHKPKK